MADHVPSEIVTDILSRLPVKPLLRFRCVSKPWCALIDSPDFIQTHLNRSIQTKTNRSLILTDTESDDPNLYSIDFDFDSLDKSVNLYHPLKSNDHNTRVWGSSNGLLCLANSVEDVVLWNPSTKRHWKLPLAPIEPPTPYFHVGKSVAYGFGFDKISDDYKVVRIVQYQDVVDDHVDSDVRVYSLKSNSWRRVRDFPCDRYLSLRPGVLVNGALHWDVTEKSQYIIGFDLGTEGFHRLRQPEYDNDKTTNLGVLEGSLCAICRYYQVGIDVWVMKEYGVNQSWTKLISIEHSNVINPGEELVPIAFSKNGQKVLFLHYCHRFFWYDLDLKTIEEVSIRDRLDEFDVIVCFGSLVPPGSGGGVNDGTQPAAQDRKKKINRKKRDGFLSEGFKLKL